MSKVHLPKIQEMLCSNRAEESLFSATEDSVTYLAVTEGRHRAQTLFVSPHTKLHTDRWNARQYLV